jgi:hypothetical protein
MNVTEQPTVRPRAMLAILLARYDHGAVPDGVWQTIKSLQEHVSWLEHVARRVNAPSPQSPTKQSAAGVPLHAGK